MSNEMETLTNELLAKTAGEKVLEYTASIFQDTCEHCHKGSATNYCDSDELLKWGSLRCADYVRDFKGVPSDYTQNSKLARAIASMAVRLPPAKLQTFVRSMCDRFTAEWVSQIPRYYHHAAAFFLTMPPEAQLEMFTETMQESIAIAASTHPMAALLYLVKYGWSLATFESVTTSRGSVDKHYANAILSLGLADRVRDMAAAQFKVIRLQPDGLDDVGPSVELAWRAGFMGHSPYRYFINFGICPSHHTRIPEMSMRDRKRIFKNGKWTRAGFARVMEEGTHPTMVMYLAQAALELQLPADELAEQLISAARRMVKRKKEKQRRKFSGFLPVYPVLTKHRNKAEALNS